MNIKYNNSMYSLNLPELIGEDSLSNEPIMDYIDLDFIELEEQELKTFVDIDEIRNKELIKNEQFQRKLSWDIKP